MSIRFYSYLWIIFGAAALVVWVGGVFSVMTAVVFGFIASGLVFTGMMGVLPTMAHFEVAPEEHLPKPGTEAIALRPPMVPAAMHPHLNLRVH
jgi:hypothetical protein